jgi:hypothetical protein
LLGQLLNKQHTYELILCDTQRNEIGIIEYTDITFNARFDSFNELNFELGYYQNGFTRIKDKNFDLTKGLFLVLMNIREDDTIIYSEYFVINKPTKSSNDIIKKSIDCIAYAEYIFNNKRLRGYKDTRKLYDSVNAYDFEDKTKGGLMNLLLTNYLYNTWSIGYLNPVLNVYHSFDFADTSYTEVFQTLEKEYNCFIFFDSINREINFYDKSEYGENTGLVLSDMNYIKSISNEDKFDQLITRLTITGKNVGIHKYNITGLGWVENYDWLIDNGYFTDSLKTAWLNYKALLASKEGQFTTYVNQLDSYEASKLQKENELAALEAEKIQIEDALDLEKRNPTNTSTYDGIYDDLQAKEAEIEDKENEISVLQSNINSVNSNITVLRNILSYSSNFTQNQLEELVEFVREQSISFDQVSDQKQLYEYAKQYIVKVSATPISFDTENIDIFTAKEGEIDRNKIVIGNFANIDCSELGFDFYPIRIVSYTYKPLSNNLSMSFSNTDKLENDLALLGKNIFKMTETISNTIEVKKYDYESYSNDKNKVLYTDSTINNNIQLGNNFINRRGFIGSEIGALSGSKIQVFNDKICITTDNWRTFHTLISGNGVFLQTENSQTIMHKDYGFAINVWNPALNDYYNSIYIGLDPLNNPAIFVDNGYLKLTRIIDNVERNRIYLDPSVGIKIQTNIGTQLAQNWVDRLYADNNGNLIAEKLRTFGDGLNFVELESQFVNFWNGGVKKLQFGFQDIGGTSYPYSIWGQGDGTNGNKAFINKDVDRFNIVFRTSNEQDNKITFINNNATFPLGVIQFTGILDFTGTGIMNFGYSYSKSESDSRYITQAELDNAIADAIDDHILALH